MGSCAWKNPALKLRSRHRGGSDLVDINRSRTATQIHRAERPRLYLILDQLICGSADDDLVRLRHAGFEPRGGIDHIPQHGKLPAFRRAYITDESASAVDRDTHA